MPQTLKLGFLASGNGSSARAIVAAIRAGELAAEPRLLVSNNRTAPALAYAAEQGVAAMHIPTQSNPDAADANRRFHHLFGDHDGRPEAGSSRYVVDRELAF